MAVPLESRQPSMRNVPPGRFDDGRESGAWGRYRESLCIRLMLAQVPNLNRAQPTVGVLLVPSAENHLPQDTPLVGMGRGPFPGRIAGATGGGCMRGAFYIEERSA